MCVAYWCEKVSYAHLWDAAGCDTVKARIFLWSTLHCNSKNTTLSTCYCIYYKKGDTSSSSVRPWLWGCTSSVFSSNYMWLFSCGSSLVCKLSVRKAFIPNIPKVLGCSCVQSTACFISALTLQTSLRAQRRMSVLGKNFYCRPIRNLYGYAQNERD